MAADHSRKTVIAALIANLAIAVTKFVAAALSGSSAMLAEGIHSLVDTGNQGFMLVGMKRAKKPADEKHPFGYGAELYFWAFIVAVLLFALGSGLSIWEGVRAILHSETSHDSVPWIPFGVLAAAFGFEGYAFLTAFSSFEKGRRNRGLIRDLRDMKDPSIFVVMCEDTAALIGIVIAAAGLALSWLTGNAIWDGAASIFIGVVLGITAIFLANEVRGLLVGESADPEIISDIREKLAARDEVVRVNEIRSIHFGPNDILLTASLDFRDDVTAGRIEAMVTEAEASIRNLHPQVRRVFLEVQSDAGPRPDGRRDVLMKLCRASFHEESSSCIRRRNRRADCAVNQATLHPTDPAKLPRGTQNMKANAFLTPHAHAAVGIKLPRTSRRNRRPPSNLRARLQSRSVSRLLRCA